MDYAHLFRPVGFGGIKTPLPSALYKFRACDAISLDRFLQRRELFFASPKNLNDPFDCSVDVASAIERCLEHLSNLLVQEPQQTDFSNEFPNHILRVVANQHGYVRYPAGLVIDTLKQLQSDLEHYPDWTISPDLAGTGIYCASALETFDESGLEVWPSNSTLMWSHYADNHKGVCLKIQLTRDFLSQALEIGLWASNVQYGDDAFFDRLLQKHGQPPMDHHHSLMVARIFSKSQAWAYENEYRVAVPFVGPIILPPDALAAIYFGLRFETENHPERDRLISLARNSFPTVKFYQMSRNRSMDFGLVATPLVC